MKKLLQLSLLSFSALLITQKVNGQCLECIPVNNTVKLGYNNTISQLNYFQTTIGNFNTISGGVQNYAIGAYNTVSGTQSMSLGTYSEALSPVSFTLGHYLKSQNTSAFVFGLGKSPTEKLTNTIESTLMIGFNSQYPTLFVGRTDINNQSGRVGIGNVTNPQAKLHIRADATEEASLRLEPTGSAYNAVVYFTNSGHAVKAKTGGHLTFSTQSTKGFVFEAGNLGIGVATPAEKLDIAGNIKQSAGSSLTTTTVKAADANGLKLYNSSGSGMFVAANGSVGIGTTNTGTEFKLTVAGGIHARDVKVTLTAGSDHVFGDKHRLAPLSEVEAFVKANKHLPGVAPESEMLQQGLDLGSFQIKLLEKIEELTLYIIAQQKEIEALKAAVGKP